ncbi:hypothetical protein GDN83_11730 [Gordonia jinghuaiqii]|uniref:Mce-associated membrane protein n=1 Tax=Gordonia jinghuaiqii TaxID=2758710 RepID=A0A7D7QZ79_9ACTN|nr:hypothetical protein [Gordonia jinghuaiqii]MCR5978387.1 hypothetical protein [Gordonia jinghuaiqii]QMT02729.1 hypothetical protein H1R19_06220 [Gordonia jinghuaiqii]
MSTTTTGPNPDLDAGSDSDTTTGDVGLDTSDTTPGPTTDSPPVSRIRGLSSYQISAKTVLIASTFLALIAVIGVLAAMVIDKSSHLDDVDARTANAARAERVALDYATAAANMDYQNPEQWRESLTSGTTPELAARLRKASTSMEQLIKPLQWTSTSSPITAKVESESNGIYDVTAFVNVLTKNAQAPDGIESTATYRLTIDSNHDWVITEITGIGGDLTGSQGTTDLPADPAPAPAVPGN